MSNENHNGSNDTSTINILTFADLKKRITSITTTNCKQQPNYCSKFNLTNNTSQFRKQNILPFASMKSPSKIENYQDRYDGKVRLFQQVIKAKRYEDKQKSKSLKRELSINKNGNFKENLSSNCNWKLKNIISEKSPKKLQEYVEHIQRQLDGEKKNKGKSKFNQIIQVKRQKKLKSATSFSNLRACR